MKKSRYLDEHGRHKARERYGEISTTHTPATGPYHPQDAADKRDAKYENDTGYVWQHCIGEEKPGFDKRRKGK